jgi:hypothetical protein
LIHGVLSYLDLFLEISFETSHNQAFSIVEKLLVEPLIKPRKLLWSFVICASIPPILYDSQANCGFCVFDAFLIADLPYGADYSSQATRFSTNIQVHLLFTFSYFMCS